MFEIILFIRKGEIPYKSTDFLSSKSFAIAYWNDMKAIYTN